MDAKKNISTSFPTPCCGLPPVHDSVQFIARQSFAFSKGCCEWDASMWP